MRRKLKSRNKRKVSQAIKSWKNSPIFGKYMEYDNKFVLFRSLRGTLVPANIFRHTRKKYGIRCVKN